MIGIGSIIFPSKQIGKWPTVGGGSVVTKNVPHNVTIWGNPAKIIHG